RRVEAVQQVELGVHGRQQVPVEVARRRAFAVEKGACTVTGGEQLLQPEPGHGDVTQGSEVRRGVGQRRRRVAAAPQPYGRRLDASDAPSQVGGVTGEGRAALGRGNRRPYGVEQQGQAGPVVLADL